MTQIYAIGVPLPTNTSHIDADHINSSHDSSKPNVEFSQPYHFARLLETYWVPITCSVGIIANTLAVKTFLHKSLRKYSCSTYLIAKCICDTIFLINLFGIYIGNCFQYDLNTAVNICQFVIFITYVSGFLSVWTVIFVTVENFIRIRLPFEVKRFCSIRNANISISLLVFLSVCIYNFSLWISDENCKPIPEFSTVTQAFIYIDTVLTLIIPSILLTVLIFAILVKLLQPQRKSSTMDSTSKLVNSNLASKTKTKVAVVTKLLLSVSLTFFLLTVTSHIVRIKLLVSAFLNGQLQLSNTEAAVQRISQLFFYLSMAVNFFIFFAFGENFRKVFKRTFRKGDIECSNQSNEVSHLRSGMLRSRSVQCEINELMKNETESLSSSRNVQSSTPTEAESLTGSRNIQSSQL